MLEAMQSEHLHPFKTVVCASCGFSISVPVPCGNRFCPVCSASRIRKTRHRLKFIIKSLKPAFGYKVRFLTLTIPHCEDPKHGVKTLLRSFRRLRQRQFWRNRVAGGCAVIEITGSPGQWHVHLHAMLECRYLPVRMLSKIWGQVSPGRIVHCKNMPAEAIINYCTKYITKSEVCDAFQVQLSSALKGDRLFNLFGSWHALGLQCPKIYYSCPNCNYDGFYLNDDEFVWEKYGRPPPLNSPARIRRDKTIQKHGIPNSLQFRIINHAN